MPLAVLDIQHRGKPGRWRDRGAVAFGVEEVDLTHRYAIAADRELRRLGWDCAILADGAYRDRWARADAYGAAVYVACHVDRLPEVVPWPVLPLATGPGERAFNTIEGVRAVALCFEPGFVDCPNEAHRRLLVARAEVMGATPGRGIAGLQRGHPI